MSLRFVRAAGSSTGCAALAPRPRSSDLVLRYGRRLLRPLLVLFASAVLATSSSAEERGYVFVYDDAGRLVTAADGDTQLDYVYDAAGNILRVDVPEPEPRSALPWLLLGVVVAARATHRRARLEGPSRRSPRVGARGQLVGLIAAALLAHGAGPASAHTLFVVFPDGTEIPDFITPMPIEMRAAPLADANGAFATQAFRSIDGFCQANLSIAQIAGPPGLVTVVPGPPIGPAFEYAFEIRMIVPPSAPVDVTFQLTWVGTGGPGEFCSTQSEFNIIMLRLLPDASSTANLSSSAVAADPINSFTGELYNDWGSDLFMDGTPMPVGLNRLYGAFLGLDGNIALPQGTMGENWLHHFDYRLVQRTTTVEVITNRGRVVTFEPAPGGTYDLVGLQDVPFQLSTASGDFAFLDPRIDFVYHFHVGGRLTRVEDGRGNGHDLTYAGNLLSQVTDGLGRTLTFSYVGSQLSSITDGTRTISFVQSGAELASFTDARGNTTSYDYDLLAATPGLLSEHTLPEGNAPFSQTFDVESRTDAQSDADGDTLSVDYMGLVTEITDPFGNVDVHTYELPGRIIEWTDAAGNVTTATYNANSQRTSITDRLGDTALFSYHAPSGKLATVTDPDGGVTTYGYTPRVVAGVTIHDLASITRQDGTVESFGRDGLGNVTTYTDQAGNAWTYTFNGRGQILTQTNAKGGVTTFTYNPDGTMATRTDPAGNLTSFGYDGLFRMTSVLHPDATTHTFTYDANGNMTSFTDGNGATSTIGYDANDNIVSMTDRLGAQTIHAYDTQDRPFAQTDPLGNTASFTYDAESRMATFTDRRGNVATYGYDIVGRLSTLTDAAGQVFTYAYDAEGVITSFTDPLGATRAFESDSMGRITRVTTALGFTTDAAYDSMGRLTTLTNALGETTTLGYDVRGQALSHQLADGTLATYQRDALGGIVRVDDPNGNAWLRPRDAQGRTISQTDPLGNVWSFSYDNRSRIDAVTLPLGTVAVTYDGQGRPIRKLFSDTTDLVLGFDAENRLTSADGLAVGYDANGSVISSNGLSMTRDAGGRIEVLTLAPGRTVTYAYDSRNLLSQITDWLGGVTTFSYDASRRLVQITRPNGVTTSYDYDLDDRLTSITEGTLASSTIARDANGQITSLLRDVPTAGAFVGVAPEVFAFDAASQVAGFTYDAMGRVTDDGARTYVWDLATRLSSYDEAGAVTTSSYDGLGYRTSRTRGASQREYVWNWGMRFPAINVERENGADLRYYVTTPEGILVYSIDATTTARLDYHYDERGNTLFLTDAGGAVVASYGHTPYGELVGSTGAIDNPFTWQGALGVVDEGNGLYSMRSRYYDARSRRFLSRDPVDSVDPRQVNRYQYALANPLRYGDPLGLVAIMGPTPLGGGGGLGAGGPLTGNTSAATSGCCPSIPSPGLITPIGGLGRVLADFRLREFNDLTKIVTEHVDDMFRHTPAEYLDDLARAFNPTMDDMMRTGGIDPRMNWWQMGQRQIDDLAPAAKQASRLRMASTGLAAAGVGLDAGLTIYDGVCHGDSAGIIAYDTTATVGADIFVLAVGASNPVVLVGDAVTLGGVSGSVQNAFIGAQGACDIVFSDRFTSSDAAALKRRMTRKPAMRAVWSAGEWLDESTGLSDFLAWALF